MASPRASRIFFRGRTRLGSFVAITGAACAGFALAAETAWGGGFEFGANGTEALGRGGAFTAKADSPLALEYNVAGLAQQRGTRVLFDSNLFFGSYRFERSGQNDLGGAFPVVEDGAHKPFYAPLFGLVTDFGYFKRFSVGIGAFGPPAIGKRSYGVFATGQDGSLQPAPSRYDVIQTDTLIIFPTIALAFRPHRVIDIGISAQQVSSVIKVASSSYAPQSLPVFPDSKDCSSKSEVAVCDTVTRVDAKSFDNFTLQLGVLLHPIAGLHIGAHVRSAVNLGLRPIEAQGMVYASEPPALAGWGQLQSERMDARFSTRLPWVVRVGVRYAFVKAAREIADLELDATWEGWGQADGSNNTLSLLKPPPLVNRGMPLDITITHNYQDTFSLRLGGSVTQGLGADAALTVRAGLLYDHSATPSAWTRLDFDTLAKVGATVGLGLGGRGVTLNLAYAYLHSLPRVVEDGELRPLDGARGGPLSINDQLVPAVNNGRYSGRNHIVSLGLSLLFDEMVRGPAWRSRRGLPPG